MLGLDSPSSLEAVTVKVQVSVEEAKNIEKSALDQGKRQVFQSMTNVERYSKTMIP